MLPAGVLVLEQRLDHVVILLAVVPGQIQPQGLQVPGHLHELLVLPELDHVVAQLLVHLDRGGVRLALGRELGLQFLPVRGHHLHRVLAPLRLGIKVPVLAGRILVAVQRQLLGLLETQKIRQQQPLALQVPEQLLDLQEQLQDVPQLARRQHLGLLAVGREGPHLDLLDALVEEPLVHLHLGVDVELLLPLLDLIEGGLGDIDVTPLQKRLHLPIEEGQQQRPDVLPVDVGVRHDDELVIAELVELQALASVSLDAGADGRDQRADLLVGEHLHHPRALDVEDLTLDGQDGLEAPVAALLGRAAGRIPLHDEQLAAGGLPFLAVREFAGQGAALEDALAPGQVLGLARRFPRLRRLHRLLDDGLRGGRILLEEGAQEFADRRLHPALHFGVAQFGLGLPLELGVADLHRQDGRQALPGVVTRDGEVLALQQIDLLDVVVDGAGQSGAEAGQMRPALRRVDVVDVGEDVLREILIVLYGALDGPLLALLGEEDGARMHGPLVHVQELHELDDASGIVEDLLLVLALVD